MPDICARQGGKNLEKSHGQAPILSRLTVPATTTYKSFCLDDQMSQADLLFRGCFVLFIKCVFNFVFFVLISGVFSVLLSYTSKYDFMYIFLIIKYFICLNCYLVCF